MEGGQLTLVLPLAFQEENLENWVALEEHVVPESLRPSDQTSQTHSFQERPAAEWSDSLGTARKRVKEEVGRQVCIL